MNKEQEERLWELFHRLWTRSVGTERYNKEEWKELERSILSIISDSREQKRSNEAELDRRVKEKLEDWKREGLIT